MMTDEKNELIVTPARSRTIVDKSRCRKVASAYTIPAAISEPRKLARGNAGMQQPVCNCRFAREKNGQSRTRGHRHYPQLQGKAGDRRH